MGVLEEEGARQTGGGRRRVTSIEATSFPTELADRGEAGDTSYRGLDSVRRDIGDRQVLGDVDEVGRWNLHLLSPA